MLAHAQGTLPNQAKLASSLGVSSPAVARYLDLLVDLLLVRRLRPWVGSAGKRLVRTAEVYILAVIGLLVLGANVNSLGLPRGRHNIHCRHTSG